MSDFVQGGEVQRSKDDVPQGVSSKQSYEGWSLGMVALALFIVVFGVCGMYSMVARERDRGNESSSRVMDDIAAAVAVYQDEERDSTGVFTDNVAGLNEAVVGVSSTALVVSAEVQGDGWCVAVNDPEYVWQGGLVEFDLYFVVRDGVVERVDDLEVALLLC